MSIRMKRAKGWRRKLGGISLALLLGGCATNSQHQISSEAQFTPAQEAAISSIVAKTLINNPSILVETVAALKVQQQQLVNQEVDAAILKNIEALTEDPNSPAVGKKEASVTVIEFFDYQCAYCHQSFPAVQAILQDDPNVKVIYKEFPIFGAASTYAAKMSLAANLQGRFAPFDSALFQSGLMEGQLTQQAVDEIAVKAGVNLTLANKEIDGNPALQAELNQNQFLANAFGMRGTPDFIVMPNSPDPSARIVTFLPGAVSEETLKAAIATAQTKES